MEDLSEPENGLSRVAYASESNSLLVYDWKLILK